MPPPKENVSSDPISQISSTLKSANNVLITVSANPSVDQLAACIGLTIAINKLKKHGTAVFSGQTPSTIEFLKPEDTLERNTDSLRDFIISLDKSKADKLRYKVEDNIVKIFITPYKTSISDKDLEFTQGDFNVDAIITLGVRDRTDLDAAIVAHGRILHDATIASINTSLKSEIGSINWVEARASSLCEMVSDLIVKIDDKLLDSQIATALLTGMVAETDRFGNEKASPHTMSVSGTLMAAGASPQLIAAKLEEPEEPATEIPEVVEEVENIPPDPDGTIEIDHTKDNSQPAQEDKVEEVPEDEIHIDEHGQLHKARDFLGHDRGDETGDSGVNGGIVLEPPRFGGSQAADTLSGDQQPPSNPNPFNNSPASSNTTVTEPLMGNDTLFKGSSQPVVGPQPNEAEVQSSDLPGDVNDSQTLTEIEKAVHSSHTNEAAPEEIIEPDTTTPVPELAVDEASQAVQQAAEMADQGPRIDALAKGELIPDHSDEQSDDKAAETSQIKPDPYVPPLEDQEPPDGPPPPPVPPPLNV